MGEEREIVHREHGLNLAQLSFQFRFVKVKSTKNKSQEKVLIIKKNGFYFATDNSSD